MELHALTLVACYYALLLLLYYCCPRLWNKYMKTMVCSPCSLQAGSGLNTTEPGNGTEKEAVCLLLSCTLQRYVAKQQDVWLQIAKQVVNNKR